MSVFLRVVVTSHLLGPVLCGLCSCKAAFLHETAGCAVCMQDVDGHTFLKVGLSTTAAGSQQLAALQSCLVPWPRTNSGWG